MIPIIVNGILSIFSFVEGFESTNNKGGYVQILSGSEPLELTHAFAAFESAKGMNARPQL